MECKKPNSLSLSGLKSKWFLWPTDKDRLLLLIKDYVKRYNKRPKNAPQEVDRPYKALPSVLKNIDGCEAKDLSVLVNILHRRYALLAKVYDSESRGEDASIYIARVEAYNEALKRFVPVLDTKSAVVNFDLKMATTIAESFAPTSAKAISSSTKGKKSKEEQDAEILAALEFVGVTLERDELGTYKIAKFKNGNGIKYYVGTTEKSFTLSKKTVNKYITDFLNKPIDSRKFTTASIVFADYIKEAGTSLGVETSTPEELQKLFGAKEAKDSTSYFKNAIKNYSRHSKVWQNFKKGIIPEENKNVSKGEETESAKKLVVADTLIDIVNDAKILSAKQIANSDYRADDISKDFGLDIDLELMGEEGKYLENLQDIAFRAVSSLHSTLSELSNFKQDVTDELTLDYMKKNEVQKLLGEQKDEWLEKKNEYDKEISTLTKKKNEDNTKEIGYYKNQVSRLDEKLETREYEKSRDEYQSARDKLTKIITLSKYYGDLVTTDLKIKKEKSKLLKTPLTINELVDSLKDNLVSIAEPSIKYSKEKIELNGTDGGKPIKRVYNLSDIEREIKALCKIIDADDTVEADYSALRDELKKVKIQKSLAKKTVKKVEEPKEEVKSNVITEEVLDKLSDSLSAMSNVVTTSAQGQNQGQATSSYLDNDLTRELIALLLEDKKRELERRKRGGRDYDDYFDDEDDYEEVRPIQKKKSKKDSSSNKTKDIFAMMLDYENDAYVENEDSDTDYTDNEDDTSDSNTSANMGFASNVSTGNNFMPNMMLNNTEDIDYSDLAMSVEPVIIPYLISYQKDGVNIYGNALETFAVYDRYRYLLETKGNLLYTFVSDKLAEKVESKDIISELRYRVLKSALNKSHVDLSDKDIASLNLEKDIKSQLEDKLDSTTLQLVTSDYKEAKESINFELLSEMIEAKAQDAFEDYSPEFIKGDLEKAVNMLGSLSSVIMSDPQTTNNYKQYSGKMKQNYINTIISKIESGELPLLELSSNKMYERLLDYLSFSIVAQNVIIEESDAKDGGFTSYPRSIFFRQKEQADETLRMGALLTAEQNAILTKRKTSIFDELGNNVTNLFGTLYEFNGSYNKLLLRLKPAPLKGGVKFMENIVDSLRLDYLPGEVAKKVEVTETLASPEEDGTSNYEDDKWFARKKFIIQKDKAREYALQIAFALKYGLDSNKTKLKETFYDANILSLSKINGHFKDISENMVSMVTSVIRNTMTITTDRFEDIVARLDKNYLIYANKMLYISNELSLIRGYESKSRMDKLSSIVKLEEEYMSKSEDASAIHPELTSPRKKVNAYMELFKYYAYSELLNDYGSDERFMTEAFEKEGDKFKRETRTRLIEKIRNQDKLNGYEVETAKYFELDLTIVDDTEDVVSEEVIAETVDTSTGIVGLELSSVDVIFAGIQDAFELAMEEEGDPLFRQDIKDVDHVLSIAGEITTDYDRNNFEIKLPIGHTIKCNIKGLIQQYLFRYITNKGEETDSFDYILNELKVTDEYGDMARNLKSAAEDLGSDELGINLIMKFSSFSEDGSIVELGENISTALNNIKEATSVEAVHNILKNDAFYSEAVKDIKEMFLAYFKRKKVEQVVF